MPAHIELRSPTRQELVQAAKLAHKQGHNHLSIHVDRLDARGLEGLTHVPNLVELALHDGYRAKANLTSRSLGPLYSLHHLTTLFLDGGRFSVRSIAKLLRQHPQLDSLVLRGCLPLDTSLKPLRIIDTLRSLTIHGPSEYSEYDEFLNDAALLELSRHPSLEVLDLWRSKRITSAGLVPLTRLPKLNTLTVGDPDHGFSPGDEFLLALPQFPSLQSLSLHTCGRNITEDGWLALCDAGLEKVVIEACHISPQHVSHLRKHFANATIRYSGTMLKLTFGSDARTGGPQAAATTANSD